MVIKARLLEIVKATSVETVWSIYTETMNSYGFDRIIYGRTRLRRGYNLGDPSDLFILSNHDPNDGYLDFFIEQGRYRDAPMLRWAFNNVGCCSWSHAAELRKNGELNEAELAVLARNKEYGVTAGYTVSFPAVSMRIKSSVAITARPGLTQSQVNKIWAQNAEDLELLNYTFDLKISTLPQSSKEIALTKRQREVLNWIGDGKTIQDTAIILGLTPATVEKHLRLARQNLNVDTTAQAVMKAALLNQMFLIES